MADAAALSPGPPPGGEPDPTPGIALLGAAAVLHAAAGGALGYLFAWIVHSEAGGLLAATQFMFGVLAGAIAYRMWEGEGGGLATVGAVALGAIGFAFFVVAGGQVAAGGILLALMVGAAPAFLEIIAGALIISSARSRREAPARILYYAPVPGTRRPPPAR